MILKNITIAGRGYSIESPDECPICHHHSEMRVIHFDLAISKSTVQVVYQCAFSGCMSYFIGYYGQIGEKDLLGIKPMKPNTTVFPKTITELSPSFVSIYCEAEEALQAGLSQIAGPGYRKAFEFLIKDYAKSLVPNKSEDIEKAFSGSIVKDYIGDPRIQAVAKRTLWLGNDETHYLKQWTAHDISDLIALIKLAINWIEIDRLSKKYCESMPE